MAGQTSSNASVFSAAEVEFLAEDDTVEIIPNVRMDSLHMICGDFGPFRPQIPTEVPLWLAIAMKKRSKCRLRPPDWMSVGKLVAQPICIQFILRETDSGIGSRERVSSRILPVTVSLRGNFQAPFGQLISGDYLELLTIIRSFLYHSKPYHSARDDITDVYLVQSLIEDVRNVRFHKVQAGLQTLKGRQHAVKLKNLSAMEVNLIRPFIVRALQSFYRHDSEEMVAQNQTQEESRVAASDRPRRTLRPR